MRQRDAVDGFRLAFERAGRGPAVVLLSVYSPPGAFAASIAWHRAGAGSVAASLAEQVPRPEDRAPAPARRPGGPRAGNAI